MSRDAPSKPPIKAWRNNFVPAESVLTTMLAENPTAASLFIFMQLAMIVVAVGHFTVNHFDEDRYNHDIEYLKWTLKHWEVATAAWLALHFFYFAFYFVVKAAAEARQTALGWDRQKFELILCVSHAVNFATTPFLALWTIHKWDFSPPLGSALILEQLRLLMKSHSFLLEMWSRPTESEKDNTNKTSFGHFLYFFFAPTLIYRHRYPRTNAIRWRFVASNFALFALTLVSLFWCLAKEVAPFFSKAGIEPFSLKATVRQLFFGGFCGYLIQLAMALGLLHCWLNAWAEMLRFADRRFYGNWTLPDPHNQTYRKWNVVVSNFLVEYVLSPVYQVSGSALLATTAAMLVSMIGHEYVFLCTQHFIPFIWTNTFGFMIVVLFPFAKLSAESWPRLNRCIYWMMPFNTFGLYHCLYALDYYSRRNCPQNLGFFEDNLTFRFLMCATFVRD